MLVQYPVTGDMPNNASVVYHILTSQGDCNCISAPTRDDLSVELAVYMLKVRGDSLVEIQWQLSGI